jgi:hypothetical protein
MIPCCNFSQALAAEKLGEPCDAAFRFDGDLDRTVGARISAISMFGRKL